LPCRPDLTPGVPGVAQDRGDRAPWQRNAPNGAGCGPDRERTSKQALAGQTFGNRLEPVAGQVIGEDLPDDLGLTRGQFTSEQVALKVPASASRTSEAEESERRDLQRLEDDLASRGAIRLVPSLRCTQSSCT
jgi:hypothetical protein